jgi:flagellar biosynthesis protein FlhG
MHTPRSESRPRAAPRDQAQGLRQLFAVSQVGRIALVANAHVAFSSVLLERLSTAIGVLGLNALVVDAADTSPPARELAAIDLAGCIETLSPRLSYLAARGLPLRHVDTRGSSASLLDRLCAAAPRAEALLVHAGAGDVARLFADATLRPVLLAADDAESLTSAYASIKLLAQRKQATSFDLLLAAPGASKRAAWIAERLASCAQQFLGVEMREWVAVDPACDVREVPSAALLRLSAEQIDVDGSAAVRQPAMTQN